MGILPWFSADTTKLMTEVNVKILSHNMINLPNNHFPYRVPNPGKLAVSHERGKCLISRAGVGWFRVALSDCGERERS